MIRILFVVLYMLFHNMQTFITILLLLVFSLYSCSGPQDSGTKQQDSTIAENSGDSAMLSLPDVIAGLPKGIEVWHEPDTFRAVKWDKDTSKYIWKHQTYFFADVSNLRIIEFGTYNFKNGKWVLGNLNMKKYGPEELGLWYIQFDNGFVKWEHPENGLIKKDVVYFDPSNYSIKNEVLVLRKGLWYYIGIDSTGKKYMGYSRYVALPEIVK
jgi:hypothetical protein